MSSPRPSASEPAPGVPARPGAWSPLRNRLFRVLWLATVASYIGTWMHDVGAGWLMTAIAPRPLMVALVQAATSLPMFLLALPAGALADIVDRRRLLLATEAWMLLAALALGVLTVAGRTSPGALLAFTFLLGLGAALSAPAWQAIIPEIVSRDELPSAVALQSVGINVARAIGPALGGVVIAALGAGAPFLLNAASFLGIMVVLWCWRRPPREGTLPAERFFSAMRTGLRYASHAPQFQAVLVRTAAFILPGSALWALLPLIARAELEQGPQGYGILLGSLGVGAVSAATVLPRLRRRWSVDRLTATAVAAFALTTLALALVRHFPLLCATMAVGGGAWLTLLSSFNTAAQTAIPSWVRARAMAIYFMLVFFGGLAAGSILWGGIAGALGIRIALLLAVAGLLLGLAAVPRWRLVCGEDLNLAPSRHWPAPVLTMEPAPRDGPVLVTVEYEVENVAAFLAAARPLRLERRRNGAMRWGLYGDLATPGRFVETFVVESWGEHLRHHERITEEDRAVEERVRRYHRRKEPPAVSHWLAADLTGSADESQFGRNE